MRRRMYGWLLTIAALSLLSISHRSAASVTEQIQQTLPPRSYLPLVARPLLTTITFGTAADQNGRPTPPLTTIRAGERKLYYNIAVQGADGQPHRIEYILPSGPLDPDQGTFVGNDINANGQICYTSGVDCENPTGTLLPGSYTIRVFIASQLIAESSATVLASLDQTEALDTAFPAVRR